MASILALFGAVALFGGLHGGMPGGAAIGLLCITAAIALEVSHG